MSPVPPVEWSVDSLFRRKGLLSLLLIVATLASYVLGYVLRSRWLLPLFNTAPAYTIMFVLVRRGDRNGAIGMMLVWAACLAIVGTCFAALFPERASEVVINGPAYRDAMIHWVVTGEGAEGRPSEFLPLHLKELALYLPLAFVTAGAGAMLMGAVLMNFMDFFVAGLALRASSPWLAAVGAWFPWSVLRVVGYVILGVVAAEPLLTRLRGARGAAPGRGRVVGVALGLLVADVVVKALFAPAWGRMLSTLVR